MIFSVLFLAEDPISVFADDSDLCDAVEKNDVMLVREYIRQGFDVNAENSTGKTPLYYAVNNGYGEIAEILIDSGADVNTRVTYSSFDNPFGSFDYSMVGYAMYKGQMEMVGLLLHNGADPEDIYRHYRNEFYSFLSEGDLSGARDLVEEAHFDFEPDLILHLHYQNSSPELCRLIENAFPDVSFGGPDLLDALLRCENKDIFSLSHIPKPRFPLASSILQDNKSPLRYSREMAFDGDLATAWVEGRDGPGIGEKIAFEVAPNSGQIEIYPGYGVREYHSSNNRLKQAVFTLYIFNYLVPQNGMAYTVKEIQSWEFNFRDSQYFQVFYTSVPESKCLRSLYFGVLEIRDIYPGSRWDDTCVAEIEVR